SATPHGRGAGEECQAVSQSASVGAGKKDRLPGLLLAGVFGTGRCHRIPRFHSADTRWCRRVSALHNAVDVAGNAEFLGCRRETESRKISSAQAETTGDHSAVGCGLLGSGI